MCLQQLVTLSHQEVTMHQVLVVKTHVLFVYQRMYFSHIQRPDIKITAKNAIGLPFLH